MCKTFNCVSNFMAKALQERDAFVLVLVDGDGLIFEDHLLQKGEAGGKEAAGQLWSAIRNHMHRQNLPDIPNDYKIVTRVYANLRGLSNICKLTGIIDNSATMEEFARGFTGSKQLFDFVDVGFGKDRADEKVSGNCEAMPWKPKLTMLRTVQTLSKQHALSPCFLRMFS
jgi:hypothetical protein